MTSHLRDTLKESVTIGLAGIKATYRPAIILQLIALCIILTYYNSEAAASFLNKIGAFNQALYPWFGIATTTFFGGILPIAIEWLLSRQHPNLRKTPLQILYTLAYWLLSGLIIVAFYAFNNWLFGPNPSLQTVIQKVLFDQFVWVFLVPAPSMVYGYLYRDVNFSTTAFREALKQRGYWKRAIPTIITNWAVWIPSTAIIYSLPTPLQIPLMNIILSIWSLLLTFISLHQSENNQAS